MQRGAKIAKDNCLDIESDLSYDWLTGASVGHSRVVEMLLRCADHIIVGYVRSHTCGEAPSLTRRSPLQNRYCAFLNGVSLK